MLPKHWLRRSRQSASGWLLVAVAWVLSMAGGYACQPKELEPPPLDVEPEIQERILLIFHAASKGEPRAGELKRIVIKLPEAAQPEMLCHTKSPWGPEVSWQME